MGYVSNCKLLNAKFTFPFMLAKKIQEASSWGWGRKERGPRRLEEREKNFQVCNVKQRQELSGLFMCDSWACGVGRKVPPRRLLHCGVLSLRTSGPRKARPLTLIHGVLGTSERDSRPVVEHSSCPKKDGGQLDRPVPPPPTRAPEGTHACPELPRPRS